MTSANSAISIEKRPCAEGAIGMLVLNRPARLNALSVDMIQALHKQLEAWREDEGIALVLLTATGERAFCVGGDIHELIELADPGLGLTASARLFAAEYRLDYTLHRYPKPIICWGKGLILGGGMGLMQGARYRLGTPDSQMAMPESTLGLFPDAGASWFLNRLPEGMGRFLGMTGAMLNSSDSLRLGLLDQAVADDAMPVLLDLLEATRWSTSIAANDNRLYRLLRQFSQDWPVTLPEGQLARHEQHITRLCQSDDAVTVARRILDSAAESPWWEEARSNLAQGCPTSPHLLFSLLEHARQMTFADIFRLELGVATHCIRRPDFREGVKARLIERNREPRWQFSQIEEVPQDYIDSFFRSPWEADTHPLRDL